MGAERRQHTRVAKHVLIRMRCVGGPVPKEADDRVATIANISKGGLGIASRKFYPPGTVLRLAFPESSMGPARTLYASVVRSGPSPTGSGYELALQFVRAPDAAPTEPPAPRPKVAAQDPGTGRERRRHLRWDQHILLKYRCVSEGILFDVEPRVGALENVSDGGLVLSVKREYPDGTLLEVRLPDTPVGFARTATIRTLWTRPHDKPAKWLVGGEFA